MLQMIKLIVIFLVAVRMKGLGFENTFNTNKKSE